MTRGTKDPAAARLPAVGTRVYLWLGPRRHRGVVLEHRLAGAWVEVNIEGAEPMHGIFSAEELEPAD